MELHGFLERGIWVAFILFYFLERGRGVLAAFRRRDVGQAGVGCKNRILGGYNTKSFSRRVGFFDFASKQLDGVMG